MSEIKKYSDLQDSLNTFIEDFKRFHDVLGAATVGLMITKEFPDFMGIFNAFDKEEPEGTSKIKESADIAKAEAENGFPFLYSQATLMLYSYLESAIKGFIMAYFDNHPIHEIKEIACIKIGFAEFMSIEENERSEYLFMQYEKSISAGIQYGVTRFETLLKPIGYSGKVDDETSKLIFELSQIRNSIIHKGAKADRFLIEKCPWLKYSSGDDIKVGGDDYQKYLEGVSNYLMILNERLSEKMKADLKIKKAK